MKVILAGLSKTGTKSMAAALRVLGYSVYDVTENFSMLGREWLKVMEEGGTVEDFRRMYESVDATGDIPAAHYWEEILEAFPDAKVILMLRENEHVWCESMMNQLEIMSQSVLYKCISVISPSAAILNRIMSHTMRIALGVDNIRKPCAQVLKIAYRNHNARVIQVVPPHQLLMYSCSQGWAPLCAFLGKNIPLTSFPHENKEGNFGKDENLKDNAGFIKIQNEMRMAFCIIGLFIIGVIMLIVYLCL